MIALKDVAPEQGIIPGSDNAHVDGIGHTIVYYALIEEPVAYERCFSENFVSTLSS